MHKNLLFLSSAISLFLFAGCAILGDVVTAPDIRNLEVQSVWSTSEQWNLAIQVNLKNPNPLTLMFTRAALNISCKGKHLTTKRATDLPVIPAYETGLYRFSVFLSRQDLLALYPVPAKNILLDLSAVFIPQDIEQLSPLKFSQQVQVPLPNIPVLNCQVSGEKAVPTGFTCTLKNENSFTLQITQATASLQNGSQEIHLLPPQPLGTIQAGQSGNVYFRLPKNIAVNLPQSSRLLLVAEITAASEGGKMIMSCRQKLKSMDAPKPLNSGR